MPRNEKIKLREGVIGSMCGQIAEFIKRNKNPLVVIRKIKFLMTKPVIKPILKEDIYLVSFPKSGNTWVRLILANLLVQKAKSKIDFFSNMSDIIPDIHLTREYVSPLKNLPRIIKSHSRYRKEYPRVIYIIRDPRDVMASSYHYYTSRNKNTLSFKKFIRSKRTGLPAWFKHYKSWENNADLIIKYEDLKKDCFKEIKKIAGFVKMNVTDKQIRNAINECEFEKLQQKDASKKGKEVKKKPFFRKGSVGQWKDLFDEEDLKYFEKWIKK